MHMQEPREDGKGERKVFYQAGSDSISGWWAPGAWGSLIAGSCMGHDIYWVFSGRLSTVISCRWFQQSEVYIFRKVLSDSTRPLAVFLITKCRRTTFPKRIIVQNITFVGVSFPEMSRIILPAMPSSLFWEGGALWVFLFTGSQLASMQ